MTGRFLLDTNILIALFAGEQFITEHLAEAESVFVPSIALGELYFGAHKSERAKDNLERVDELAAQSTVLGCDLETARQYGAIKDRLRIKGRPLPENDIWIAALALQHGLTLVTRDSHFQVIDA